MPVILLLLIWQLVSGTGLVPGYMLPQPINVAAAFIGDFKLLMAHLLTTLTEAFWGLAAAVIASFLLAIIMDAANFLKKAISPLLLFTQTMPVIALAPLLILWLGYGSAPKITLVFLTCFFPMTIGLLGAFDQADSDAVKLLQSMGAGRVQIYRYIKLPQSLPAFFAGLRISSSYAIIGAVIAEWLGGESGLGVYMTRVRRSYSFDKMFAVILLTAALSLVLIKLVSLLERAAMPWKKAGIRNSESGIRSPKGVRGIPQVFTVFAAIGFLASCAKPADPGLVRVCLDWTPNTNHTGLYVALDKGWFAEEGLNVRLIQPPEDGALLLLASGKAEFAVDFQESLGPAIAKNKDALPVTAVAAIISHNTSGIISLASSGIERPRDLEGKRFASWETPVVNALIKNIVEADGGDFSKVQMVPNNATDAFSAMQTDVDAVWIYYAWDGIAAEVKNIETNYLDLGKLNPLFDFYTPVLVVNNNWAAKNPETVKKFLKAANRGYNFAMENPAEAADILLKYAPELDRDLVVKSQQYLASRYQGDASRWGEIDPIRWNNFYQWMYSSGLLEIDPAQIGQSPGNLASGRPGGFTNEFLPQ